MDTTTSPKTKPAHTIREADVKATIWLNHSEKGEFYNVTLSRFFMGDDEQPKDTSSFGVHDLLKVQMVVKKAQAWIMNQSEE